MTFWQPRKLSEVCVIDKQQGNHIGLPYVGMEHIESGTGRFIGDLAPVEVKSTTFKFSSDHVLYGRLRPYLNKVMVPDFEAGHCSTEIFPLRPVKEQLCKKFLFYWLTMQSTVDHINRTCTGARMPRANMNEVLTFTISVPPLPEQQRIVTLLDESFEGIEAATAKAEQNLKNARGLFDSYLNSLCRNHSGEGKITTLGEVCDLYQGLAINSKTKHLLDENGSIPLLRIKDLRNGTSEQFVKNEGWPSNAYIEPNDLVYTRTGQIGLVFKGREGVLHNNAFKVSPRSELSPEYLYWWLQHTDFKDLIISLASRAAQPDITHKLFKEQKIFLPTINAQLSAAEKLDLLNEEVSQLATIYQQKLSALSELKQSILQKAFAGELH
ncbi:hypothetical protein GCM10009104_08680 [Marinobacterium maritimum]|uniref:Type I restriction modification DNA specificity domain-containing protein n=1 Tax=Marinobacterium maritimum TaxID=500162 RepID=A0ABP3TCZ2_9GAMM